MSARTRDWLIAIVYVAFIFSTLGVVRPPIAYLRVHNCLRLLISLLFFICFLRGLRILLRNYPGNIYRLIFFVALLFTYYFVARTIKLPEEQLHFFEYGLVGIFFLRALQHFKMSSPILYLSAWAISSTTGWGDELLQGITPGRHYDIRDIGFNVVASGLGLLVYLICKNNKTS